MVVSTLEFILGFCTVITIEVAVLVIYYSIKEIDIDK